jgi:hypothetical protein
MHRTSTEAHRVQSSLAGRQAGQPVRTSDLAWAVIGVALLGGVCLLLAASLATEAQGLVDLTGTVS